MYQDGNGNKNTTKYYQHLFTDFDHSVFESQKAFQPKSLIVLYYVLFVCKCVLYYCHRLQPNYSYKYIDINISINININISMSISINKGIALRPRSSRISQNTV